MPKYCSVLTCRNDGDRKSFYKFPLQDPARLQQWLKNMGRENWTPSRHQYICHQHFAPSCFKFRWGIRYLDSDAVPTIFQEAEKRKATEEHDKKPKRLRSTSNPRTMASDDEAAADAAPRTVHLCDIVDPSHRGETSLLELSDVGSPDVLTLADGFEMGGNFPFLTLFQTVDDPTGCGEATEVVLMSDCPVAEGQQVLVNGNAAAFLTQSHGLVTNDSILGFTDETVAFLGIQDATCPADDFSDIPEDHKTEVIAYFETIPNVFPSETTSHFAFPPDTVLSSALGSNPITSTLPIVSKHLPPSQSSLGPKVERVDTAGGEGDGGESEEDGLESQDHQLEEHCYHKSSVSKEQLEDVVVELQKKVKLLQQRHRRHLEKLLGLENTVSQLRQSNLLNEERLQLLERAYLQTNATATEAGDTVTIIYEEDSAAYLYAPLTDVPLTEL